MLDALIDLLGRILYVYCEPLINNDAYRTGYIIGIISIGFLYGFVKVCFLDPWKKVQAFFAATRRPATNAGPSPFQTMQGCLIGIILILICVVMIFAFVIYPKVSALSLP